MGKLLRDRRKELLVRRKPKQLKDLPHLLQCEPRFRHMIDSVTAYNQVGTAAQEGKVFGLPREMYGSAADLIFDQHSELLIEHRSESIAMLTAPGNAARSPAQPQPKLTMLLLSVPRT